MDMYIGQVIKVPRALSIIEPSHTGVESGPVKMH